MNSPEHEDRTRAARVAASVELLDLRIRRVEAELHRPAAEGPFSFVLEVKPSVSRVDSLVVYNVEYGFSSSDDDGEVVLDGRIEFSVLYQLPSDYRPSDEELAAFGRVSVLFTAYPYLREALHSLTGRMGLPPLILEVMRSPLDAELSAAAE
jgi:hypothetical protein